MKTRVISAIVLLTITFTCVLVSPVTRVLFFAAAAALCAYEFSKNVEKLEARCTLWVMFVYIAFQAALVILQDVYAVFDTGMLAYCVLFVFCIYLALFSGVIHKEVSGKGALFTLAGLTYPCVLFGAIMVISVSRIWAFTLILACLSTWGCDSFAMFGGKWFGKHKVAPLVSPNKTVEGCVTGAVSSLFVGLIVYFIFKDQHTLSVWLCMGTAFLASTMGQIGDLAESLLKRMIGVKDFSNLIPGHGGMFDRADSLLFSIPTAYLCLFLANI